MDVDAKHIAGAAVVTAAVAGCATTDQQLVIRPEVLAVSSYTYSQSREPLTALNDALIAASGREVRQLAAELTAVLTTNATNDAKQEICQMLWKYADEENVSGIAPLLQKEGTADMARYALERMEGRAVDAALVSALSSAPDAAKAGIINSLAARGTDSAASAIRPFSNHSDVHIAESARAALGTLA
ncbi:MAG: hypothetical protein VCC01_00550 [Candidatus Hydrogenedentota bacterium]